MQDWFPNIWKFITTISLIVLPFLSYPNCSFLYFLWKLFDLEKCHSSGVTTDYVYLFTF